MVVYAIVPQVEGKRIDGGIQLGSRLRNRSSLRFGPANLYLLLTVVSWCTALVSFVNCIDIVRNVAPFWILCLRCQSRLLISLVLADSEALLYQIHLVLASRMNCLHTKRHGSSGRHHEMTGFVGRRTTRYVKQYSVAIVSYLTEIPVVDMATGERPWLCSRCFSIIRTRDC